MKPKMIRTKWIKCITSQREEDENPEDRRTQDAKEKGLVHQLLRCAVDLENEVEDKQVVH
eukprot:CAMPEP_0180811846 /NCGR_PEP_ID=MMETSP1038_2-20121128/65660_1 /TAXON_ID=632150 /ORGANISM="Azadinium spinosum, Strain 3D9" /LENGTH=59 /DNA_ID=CAMNT_0022853279 /DNA_START=100 /DNA_END=279 /DNA_ORIENTATION=-